MSDFHETGDSAARPEPHGERAGNHEAGIYVDLVSGEALFASSDMYGLATRCLNFSQPLDPAKCPRGAKQLARDDTDRTTLRAR